MKKTKNKILIISIILIIIVLILGLVYFTFNYKSKNTLTLEENKWIDSNKYNVIDIAVLNEIPILSYNGKGLVYDYIDYVTQNYSLKFNPVTYKLGGEMDYDYKVDVVSSPSDNDIVLLKDNLVLVTIDGDEYVNLNNISNIKLGILSSDSELIKSYLKENDLEFIEYDTYNELKQALLESFVNKELDIDDISVDGIIIPKTIFTKEIIENNYVISFYFNDLSKYFILDTNGPVELNSIMQKSFNIWKDLNYEESYNKNLLDNYFAFKNVSDTDQKKLQSKNYNYGFIDYGIYNSLNRNKISGFNELILKDFNEFSGLSIKYTKYNSISRLLKDLNSGELDFAMNIVSDAIIDVSYTVGSLSNDLVVVSGISNTNVVDSLYSLKDKEVLTIKDSYLEKYLIDSGIKVKSYANLNDLVTDFSDTDLTLIDLENYNYYKTSVFKDSKISYVLDNNSKYNYIINNTEDNVVFKEIFNFYLNYNSSKELISNNYDNISYQNTNIVYILIFIIIVLCVYLVVDFSNHVKYMIKRIKKNKQINLSKEDKIKYIDQLTSLKNRAYLNSKIESWDESEVYPQAVIVIDLNNISYINDNYGREEGDKVITEAANILIQYQLHNSEIIRTDGNEFLVYLVGYEEKQIISYLRKLNKELKNLSHGFGAASGYSIITDAIKTFDDAVNEATLDMKNNKEDINY